MTSAVANGATDAPRAKRARLEDEDSDEDSDEAAVSPATMSKVVDQFHHATFHVLVTPINLCVPREVIEKGRSMTSLC